MAALLAFSAFPASAAFSLGTWLLTPNVDPALPKIQVVT